MRRDIEYIDIDIVRKVRETKNKEGWFFPHIKIMQQVWNEWYLFFEHTFFDRKDKFTEETIDNM